MKQIIIGIHGLGNKPSAHILKEWWLKSIKEGLENTGKSRNNIPFELVHWADILNEDPLDMNVKENDDPLHISEPYVQGTSTKRDDDASMRIKVLQYIEDQLDKIFLNNDFTINFKNVTDKIIHRYFTELDTYYGENSTSIIDKEFTAKESIQNRLSSLLAKYKNHNILLIAHSMGSIIAFDVLSNLSDQYSINTFVTIGSPLGLPVIGGRIFAEQKLLNSDLTKPATPNSISKNWYNMSDSLDKIALDHTLSDDFDANNIGIKAIDISVYNNYEINNESNPHKSFGYLRTPELATIIDGFLKRKRSDNYYQIYKSLQKSISDKLNTFKNILKRK